MFSVRSLRVLPSVCTVGAFLHCLRPRRRPDTLPPARRLSGYASFSTRQWASAFNQPLSFDTSSVTTMQSMFNVRSAPPYPQPAQSRLFLHTARAAAGSPTPSHPVCRPSSYASFFTWQRASAFDQPLSLDTPRVVSMYGMFRVRSARALPSSSTVGPSQHAGCTVAASHALLRPCPHPIPLLGRTRRCSTSR